MTHYTILPWELIWESTDTEEIYGEVEVDGVLLQVRLEQGNRATIVRMLRGELKDYMNPEYAPGQEIIYLPTLQNRR
ncbi:YlzJ-like family protein [Paenibacillus sp. YPG26]|uniref:YlzJ-like family protein n=1 Tax=Paenibacillus sp. YPG26 TaxID=2878915 RepID=UPI0020415B95|nr:YlzJ-like family protein [Paenibacillus sp. YPG26]USB32035.1 YlzJ-like family protein [Paenibacillus sp. YPG26]